MCAKSDSEENSIFTQVVNFRQKLGLANWEIRPWVIKKKKKSTFISNHHCKCIQPKNYSSTMKIKEMKPNISWRSNAIILLVIWSLLAHTCYTQETETTIEDSTELTETPITTPSTELAGGSTITAVSTISPYLKPGVSYMGQTSATRLADTLTSVAVLVSIDNWTKWNLSEPENEMNSGVVIGELPENIAPGQSEMAMFGKDSGISGVSGALTYRIEMHPKECELAHYLQIMWSVPYNLNTYRAYFAVGVSDSYFNSSYTTDSLYNTLYYYSGTFERAEAGTMVEYTIYERHGNVSSESENAPKCKPVKVRGTMTPDTYKPIVAVSVLPTHKEDGFLEGKYFEDENSKAESINHSLRKNILILFTTVFMSAYFS